MSEMREKSLGNLTPKQLRQTLKLADEMPTLGNLNTLLASRPKFRQAVEEAGTIFQWAWAYELSTPEMIAFLAWAIDVEGEIVAAAESEDPQAAIFSYADRDEEPSPPEDVPTWRKLLVLELLAALIKCFQSYRSYSVSMCDLVAKSREGNWEAALQAIRIDPTVLAGVLP